MWRALRTYTITAAALAAALSVSAAQPRTPPAPTVYLFPNPVPPMTTGPATGVDARTDADAIQAPATILSLVSTSALPVECHLRIATSTWFNAAQLEWTIELSPGAPTNVQVLAFVQDWDYLWFQNLLPGFLQPGGNSCRLDLTPTAPNWEPRGHEGNWNARALLAPKDIGIRLFGGNGGFTARVEAVHAILRPEASAPPVISHVLPNRNRLPCFERFELTFDLPDRYANPFDPGEIDAEAVILTPQGDTNKVPAFYTQGFYRQVQPSGENIVPQGPPRWKVRYAPRTPGEYRYTITARDAAGATTWGPGVFSAVPGRNNGYVRVSRRDPRYFEFNDATPFFPIGHNIRSPSDTRMNSQFPWVKRWTEGTSSYYRYFPDMEAHGENMAEIWMAAWSLGLEWSDKWPGYHNVGQYNTRNAWEMDRVIEEAERRGIVLNVVIHNHGKYGQMHDTEWQGNPMNVANGGSLTNADQFFTDPGAKRQFLNLMRYTVARWGYSTSVFAWELWSELNLTGTKAESYKRQEVVDWHRFAATAIRGMDLDRHLITTHYCTDYTLQNTNITALAEMSHLSIDAYYTSASHLEIVSLLSRTAEFNAPFGKPVLVTEFGGGWNAQGLPHLINCLHAGLWASTAIPVAGTPLFWWWGIVEEQNLYPKFQALSRFMKGEDRRDPALRPASPILSAPEVKAVCLQAPYRALGWIYAPSEFTDEPPPTTNKFRDVAVTLAGMSNGTYQAEFWDTTTGTVVSRSRASTEDGDLTLKAPPFRRDIAFKIRAAR